MVIICSNCFHISFFITFYLLIFHFSFYMPVVTSQYWNIVYGREEGQAALDTEGMQTMHFIH